MDAKANAKRRKTAIRKESMLAKMLREWGIVGTKCNARSGEDRTKEENDVRMPLDDKVLQIEVTVRQDPGKLYTAIQAEPRAHYIYDFCVVMPPEHFRRLIVDKRLPMMIVSSPEANLKKYHWYFEKNKTRPDIVALKGKSKGKQSYGDFLFFIPVQFYLSLQARAGGSADVVQLSTSYDDAIALTDPDLIRTTLEYEKELKELEKEMKQEIKQKLKELSRQKH